MQGIIRDYYEQLYANKVDHIEKIDKFLERYNLPRLVCSYFLFLPCSVTSTEIETVIWKLPTNKSRGPDGFTGEFYQTFREELTPILLKLFQKIAEEGTLPNSFYKAAKTTQQYHKKRKLQANITDEHRCKNPQENKLNNKVIHNLQY